MGGALCAPFFYNSIFPDYPFDFDEDCSSYDSKLQWEIVLNHDDSRRSIISALSMDDDLRELASLPMNQKSFFVDPTHFPQTGLISHTIKSEEIRPISKTEPIGSSSEQPNELPQPSQPTMPLPIPMIPENPDDPNLNGPSTSTIVEYLNSLSSSNPKIHTMLSQLHQIDTWLENHQKKPSLLSFSGGKVEMQEKREQLLKGIQEEVQIALLQQQQTIQETPNSLEIDRKHLVEDSSLPAQDESEKTRLQ